MQSYEEILAILDELEQQLAKLALWGGAEGRPCEESFVSQTPFCLDAMEFHQWLEYVLIARLRQMIKEGALVLPFNLVCHTLAEELYKEDQERYQELIAILKKLDERCAFEHR